MAESVTKNKEGIVFFGEIDRNEKGVITSEYPAWGHLPQIETMENEIRGYEIRLKEGKIPEDERPYAEQHKKELKARLNSIIKSKPKLSSVKKDFIANQYQELGEKVGDRLFPRSSMMKGTASPQEEARRMTEPCIKVDVDMAEQCNVPLDSKGRATRNGASKIWRICGSLIGESQNVEELRRD